MSYRFVVPAVASPAAEVKPPTSAYDLGDKVKAAKWIGIFTAILMTVGLWVVLFFIRFLTKIPWELWAAVPAIGLVCGIVTACLFGFQWVYLAACRAWLVDDDERDYRRGLETKARKEQEEAARQAADDILNKQDDDGNPATVSDVQRLHLLALLMLRRHYVEGKPATREAMTKEKLCTQPEWNAVNEGMTRCGIRKGYSFQPPDFQSAWAMWLETVRFAPDGWIEIMSGKNGWKAVERWKAEK